MNVDQPERRTGMPGPVIIVGIVFALLVGVGVLAFTAGFTIPMIQEGEAGVLGFFEAALAVIC